MDNITPETTLLIKARTPCKQCTPETRSTECPRCKGTAKIEKIATAHTHTPPHGHNNRQPYTIKCTGNDYDCHDGQVPCRKCGGGGFDDEIITLMELRNQLWKLEEELNNS